MNLREYLARQQQLVDARTRPPGPAGIRAPETIHRAMRYSLFAGGKRIRPILCMEAARAVSDGDRRASTACACSLELIHTYSLIHDDLPALDNDDYRRGKLTNHKVFGDAMAILAGDALLTLAFQVLAQLDASGRPQDAADRRTRHRLRHRRRHDRRTGGRSRRRRQAAQRRSCWNRIHRAKTGALLRASLRLGAIYAGADAEQYAALSCYGEHVGLAFQIVDDILDVEESSEALGKTAGKDAAAAQDHVSRGLRPGDIAPHGGGGMRPRPPGAGRRSASRAARLHELADLIVHRKS